VLEIGGGTGFNLEHYPRELDELVVTDPSEGMLGRLERRAAHVPPPVRLVRAPAEQLPFEDASFDTVVSTFVLCSVDDQDAALAEIRRVLAPGGRFLFLEHVRADDPRLARRQDRLERPWGFVAFGCHPNRPTGERIEAAGLEVEAIERGELPNSPRLVRPLITGRAVKR
jgi:SAM-dependent methyltransferase